MSRVGRDVREPLDLAPQRNGLRAQLQLEPDPAKLPQPVAVVVERIAEVTGGRAVRDDPLEVDVTEDQLLLDREALGLGEALAALVDQSLAIPGQVGGRLAGPGSGEYVAGDHPHR